MGFLDLFKSKSKESADKTLSLIIFDLESLGYELPDLKFLTGRSQVMFWLFYRKPVPHLQKRLSEWGRVESFDEEKGRTLELVVGYELGQNPNYKEVILVTAEGKKEGIQSFFKDKGINFQHMRTGARAQSRSSRSEPTAKSRTSEAASHNANRVGADPKAARSNDGKTPATRYERQETYDDLRPDPRLERGEFHRDLRPDPRMPSIEPKTPVRTDANRKDRTLPLPPKAERTPIPPPRYEQPVSPPKAERTPIPPPRYEQPASPPKAERTPTLPPRYEQPVSPPKPERTPSPSPRYEQPASPPKPERTPSPSPRYEQPASPPKPERTPMPPPRYEQPASPPKPERTPIPPPRYEQPASPPKPERTPMPPPRYDDYIANDTNAAPDDFYPRPHIEERPFWEWEQERTVEQTEIYTPHPKNERSRNAHRPVEPDVHSPVQEQKNDWNDELPFEIESQLPYSTNKRPRNSQTPAEPYAQSPVANRNASPESDIPRPRREPPLSSVPVPYADVITSGQTLPPLDPTRKIKPDPKNYEPTPEDFRKIALHFYNRFPVGEVFSKSFLGMAINQATGRTLQEIFKTKGMRPILAYMVQAGYIEEVDNQNFRLLSPPPVQAFIEARNFALHSMGMA